MRRRARRYGWRFHGPLLVSLVLSVTSLAVGVRQFFVADWGSTESMLRNYGMLALVFVALAFLGWALLVGHRIRFHDGAGQPESGAAESAKR